MAHPLLSLILAGPAAFDSASRRLIEAQRPALAPAVAQALADLTRGTCSPAACETHTARFTRGLTRGLTRGSLLYPLRWCRAAVAQP